MNGVVMGNYMKILIIRFSSMGDVILTSPVIRCLKLQLPDAEVHYLSKSANYELLRANPYLHKIHLLDVEADKVIAQLQKERFDYVIDLHHNLRSWKFKRALSGKKYSFNKLNWAKWLRVQLKIDILPRVHIVERYLDAVKALGVKNDGQGLDYFIPEDSQMAAPEFSPLLAQSYVAFSIGGQHQTKKLPQDKITAICRQIPHPILLMGGKEDAKVAEAVVASCPGQSIVSSCGAVNINQSASLLQQAAVVISHDTALMHMAAAFGKKTIAVWGNTIPELGMYPYLPQHPEHAASFEVKGLSCRPCSKIGFSSCPKGHFNCMQQQNFEAIARQAVKWVK